MAFVLLIAARCECEVLERKQGACMWDLGDLAGTKPAAHSVRLRSARRRPSRAVEEIHASYFQFLTQHPLPGIPEEEVQAHFRCMPMRYWQDLTQAELVWGLQTIHEFLHKLASGDTPFAPVVARWRNYPRRGFVKVMICSWDRPGLLARVAAAFTSLGLSILRADVYTRSDNLVLDVFEVTGIEPDALPDSARLSQLSTLIENGTAEPASLLNLRRSQRKGLGVIPKLEFSNAAPTEHTVLRVVAPDRPGLLYDLLRVLADSGANVSQAVVATDDALARDIFYITDLNGRQIVDDRRLKELRESLLTAIERGPRRGI
jgi:[protein-PII] uridylyltransferase